MFISRYLFLVFGLSSLFADFDYSLEDLNINSEFNGQIVGTSFFSNQVTIHYFGHYN